MSFRIYSLLILAVASLWGCQQDVVTPVEGSDAIDSIAYSFSVVERTLTCAEDEEKNCLEVSIQQIAITDGPNSDVLDKIQDRLVEAIEETDNSDSPNPSAENIADNLVKEYSQILLEMPNYQIPWNYESRFEVHLNHSGLFGIGMVNYSFTGAAHGNGFINYYTFDVKSGEQIGIKELLLPGRFDEFFAQAEARFREEQGLKEGDSYGKSGFWFEDDRFALNDNFTYTPEGIAFLYNPYEIAAYVRGDIVLKFSYAEVEQLIKPEYRFKDNSDSI